MRVSVSEAKDKLSELVQRAEEGDEVFLTRHGVDVARITPVRAAPDKASRRKLIDSVQSAAALKAAAGPSAARSQDFLYGEDGLPK